MLVKLGLGFGLRSITDILGVAKREFGCVKIPIEIHACQIESDGDSKTHEIESGAARHPVKGDAAIYMDFVGPPFPVGSTIPICLDPFLASIVLEELAASSQFYQTFYERHYEEGWSQKKFLSLSIETMERRNNEYFQQTEALKLRIDTASDSDLYSMLREASWNLIRDEAKFFEFSYFLPESEKRTSSVDFPAIFRRRNIF